jgi:hypothetical protein
VTSEIYPNPDLDITKHWEQIATCVAMIEFAVLGPAIVTPF